MLHSLIQPDSCAEVCSRKQDTRRSDGWESTLSRSPEQHNMKLKLGGASSSNLQAVQDIAAGLGGPTSIRV